MRHSCRCRRTTDAGVVDCSACPSSDVNRRRLAASQSPPAERPSRRPDAAAFARTRGDLPVEFVLARHEGRSVRSIGVAIEQESSLSLQRCPRRTVFVKANENVHRLFAHRRTRRARGADSEAPTIAPSATGEILMVFLLYRVVAPTSTSPPLTSSWRLASCGRVSHRSAPSATAGAVELSAGRRRARSARRARAGGRTTSASPGRRLPGG